MCKIEHIFLYYQVSMRNPKVLVLSVALPLPPQEVLSFDGLPFGAIEAIKAAYGIVVQILDPPKDGFDLTLKINFAKLPSDEGPESYLSKVISVLLYCVNHGKDCCSSRLADHQFQYGIGKLILQQTCKG
jgi:actin related protein 2/3 complex, subunit 2